MQNNMTRFFSAMQTDAVFQRNVMEQERPEIPIEFQLPAQNDDFRRQIRNPKTLQQWKALIAMEQAELRRLKSNVVMTRLQRAMRIALETETRTSVPLTREKKDELRRRFRRAERYFQVLVRRKDNCILKAGCQKFSSSENGKRYAPCLTNYLQQRR
jgi:hypothetical protein